MTSTRLLTPSGSMNSTFPFSSLNLASDFLIDLTLVVKTMLESCSSISRLIEHSGMKFSWIFVATFFTISETFVSSWLLHVLSEIFRMSKFNERAVGSSEYQPDFVEWKQIIAVVLLTSHTMCMLEILWRP